MIYFRYLIWFKMTMFFLTITDCFKFSKYRRKCILYSRLNFRKMCRHAYVSSEVALLTSKFMLNIEKSRVHVPIIEGYRRWLLCHATFLTVRENRMFKMASSMKLNFSEGRHFEFADFCHFFLTKNSLFHFLLTLIRLPALPQLKPYRNFQDI